MTAEEMATALKDLKPEQFVRLMEVLPELKKGPDLTEKPPLPRQKLYIPPHGELREVWSVDVPGWLAAGASKVPPNADQLKEWSRGGTAPGTEAKAGDENAGKADKSPSDAKEPLSGDPAIATSEDDHRTLTELREEFKRRFPNERIRPRAKIAWYRERLK